MNDAVREALRRAGIAEATTEPLWPDAAEPILLAALPGSGAFSVVEAARGPPRTLGCVPVLLGGGAAVARLRDYPCYDPAEPAAEIIARSADVDPEGVLLERLREHEEEGPLPHGAWPDQPNPPHELLSHVDILTMKPLDLVSSIKACRPSRLSQPSCSMAEPGTPGGTSATASNSRMEQWKPARAGALRAIGLPKGGVAARARRSTGVKAVGGEGT